MQKLNKKCNDDDVGISSTSLHISLKCPLGKTRLATPCRGASCKHLQCFDGNNYLSMNERKATWMCPVCDTYIPIIDLIIDGLVAMILCALFILNILIIIQFNFNIIGYIFMLPFRKFFNTTYYSFLVWFWK